MDSTSNTPDVPGAPGTDREEGRSSVALPPEDSAVAGLQKATKKMAEEDWMATGDPAFWLKE